MARGSAPGERRGGRVKGTKNRTTVERELIAAEVARRQTSRAHEQDRELAVEVMARYMREFEDAAAHFRPVAEEEVAAGEKPNPNGDWAKFGQWAERVVATARELARYQSPQLRAVMVSQAPPVVETRKRFTLTVFEGGKPLPPPQD
jgi:nitrogen fixation protein FixH